MSRSLVLFLCLAGFSVLSAALAVDRFYLKKDYFVYANVPCDTTLYSCFIGDGDSAPQFYMEVQKKAYAIPPCDARGGTCGTLACAESENDCSVTYCSSDAGDSCYGPVIPATASTTASTSTPAL